MMKPTKLTLGNDFSKLPQQAAPVQRKVNVTSTLSDGNAVEASFLGALIGTLAPLAIHAIGSLLH